MKIKIEKKVDKFIVYFIDEKEIRGLVLTADELIKLKNNLDQMFEYNMEEVGDNF